MTRTSSHFVTLCIVAGCTPQQTWTVQELAARDDQGMTLLHRTSATGALEDAARMLEQGAKPNARDLYDRTPLHWAALSNEAAICELLIERGANIEARSWYDLTPLHWAALRGGTDAVDLLVEHGANANARTIYGTTPLHESGNRKVVHLLVEAGAPIDAVDELGMTPLHLARMDEVARTLVRTGGNVLARANDGRMPRNMATAIAEKTSQVIVYPGADTIRLRGERSGFKLMLRNIFPTPVDDIELTLESRAATFSNIQPQRIERLHPAQRTSFAFALDRVTDIEPGDYTARIRLDSTGEKMNAELVSFTLPLRTQREELPEDRGWQKVATVQLVEEPSRIQWLLPLTAPLLLLFGWLIWRRRKKGTKKGTALPN